MTDSRLTRETGAMLVFCVALLAGSVSAANAQGTTVVPSESPSPTSPQAPPTPPPASSPSSTSPSTNNSSRSSHIEFGPDVGLYLPTSSKTRNRFGSSWFSVGIGIGSVQPAQTSGGFGFDATLISHESGNSHAYIVPIGVQYRKALSADSNSVPYVGIGADLILADLRSPVASDDVHSGLRTTGGAAAILGTTINRNGYVEARYEFISSIKGFDLSGINLSAGIRF